MKIPLYQVDAFASEVFSGNPAAVCILDAWPENRVLQGIAAENNLSETAFLVPNEQGFDLRWFTPVTEVALCGQGRAVSGGDDKHMNHSMRRPATPGRRPHGPP